jgi:BolA protein
MTRRDARIRTLLSGLAPVEVVVINESAAHHGHAGDDGSGETHYRVRVVAEAFAGKSRVERQRMIYALLAPEFDRGLHALSLEVATPQESQS